jgi:polyvinyl alcohol dehydrogenase (cytochrome)
LRRNNARPIPKVKMKRTEFERRDRGVVSRDLLWTPERSAWLFIAMLVSLSVPEVTSFADSLTSTQSSDSSAATSMHGLAGKAFASHCVQCHSLFGVEGFKRLTPTEFYSALRHGQMQEPATGLDDGTLHALAETFGNPQAASQRPPNGGAVLCKAQKPEGDDTGAGNDSAAWAGFFADSRNSRSIGRSFTKADLEGAHVKWTFVIPEAAAEFWVGAGNPLAAAHGRLYVANINRWMYALDAKSGCAYWTFRADAPIRSGAAVDSGIVSFGDARGNVYGLDEETGRLRWRHLADEQSFARITGDVTAEKGRVFVPVSSLQETLTVNPDRSCCTSNGSAVAYDIRSGALLWQTFMIDQPLRYLGKTPEGVNRFGPSGVGLLAPPTVDAARNRVYVTTANQTTGPFVPESDAVIALDLATGAKQWVTTLAPKEFGGQDIFNLGCVTSIDAARKRCPPENPGPGDHGDRDFTAPAMLVRQASGRDMLIAGSKDGMVYALDPDAKGALMWQLRVGKGGDIGGILSGMAADGGVAYVPITDVNFLNPTGDGALNAVDLATGKRIWRTPVPRDDCKNKGECTTGIYSPPVVIGDVVIVGSMDGVLRGYEKKTGRQFWSFDAVREFAGVNGYQGRGGGFGMGGVAIVGNMMFISSGAGFGNVGLKGNAVLAFELGRAATQH